MPEPSSKSTPKERALTGPDRFSTRRSHAKEEPGDAHTPKNTGCRIVPSLIPNQPQPDIKPAHAPKLPRPQTSNLKPSTPQRGPLPPQRKD